MSNRRRTRQERERRQAAKVPPSAPWGDIGEPLSEWQEPEIVFLLPGEECPYCDVVHDLPAEPPKRAKRHSARPIR